MERTYGEKLSLVATLTRQEGWAVYLERYRRNRETILRQMLDPQTPDAETLALKRAYTFLEENDPQRLAESMIREFRVKDRLTPEPAD
jgi:hypothetical protein